MPVEATGAPLTCVVCGGTQFVPRFPGRVVPRAAVAGAAYRITHSERRLVGALVRCTTCGLGMLPPQWADAVRYEEAADPYYTEQARERIANADRLLRLVPGGGRLLDVGCACGFLLVAARERGFEAEGVEMSQWASEYARREYGLPVHTGRLDELALRAESYDVVVLADVIEHLTDPRRTLREIHRVTRRGGRLLLLTPDAGSLVARLAGPRWWGLLDDHYVYFSRSTLRRLLESEGYAVEHLGALGREFPLAHWIFKLAAYSPTWQQRVADIARRLRLDRVRLSVNLGDQMACVAQKK